MAGELGRLGVSAADSSAVEAAVVAQATRDANTAAEEDVRVRLVACKAERTRIAARYAELSASAPSARVRTQLNALMRQRVAVDARERKLLEAEEVRKELTAKFAYGGVGEGGAKNGTADGREPAREAGETEKEFLVRTGVLTPFAGQSAFEKKESAVEPIRRRLVKTEHGHVGRKRVRLTRHEILAESSFVSSPEGGGGEEVKEAASCSSVERVENAREPGGRPARNVALAQMPTDSATDLPDASSPETDDDRYEPSEEGDSDFDPDEFEPGEKKVRIRKRRRHCASSLDLPDDVDEETAIGRSSPSASEVYQEEEEEEEVLIDGGLKVPGSIYDRLFEYQKVGVRWLWELHCQSAGAILGDEMGLGKTVQIVAFLASLDYSGKLAGSTIIVAPATVLQQWRREVQNWWPRFKVTILHHSADCYHEPSKRNSRSSGKGRYAYEPEAIIDSVTGRNNGLLITSYEQVRKHHKLLLDRFEYVILDEGHKIRNPDAEITLVCKRFDTPRRIIVSGSPLQNHLKELWSLFDFVFPGKLGTLPVFEAQFVAPITIGGYSTASKSQVHTAFRCAVTLKDLVSPYLLRRMKKDVALQLPKKEEQVLFCRLSQEQRDEYRDFLGSRWVRRVMNGQLNLLYAVTVLRKICNHPDIPKESAKNIARIGGKSGRQLEDVNVEADVPKDLLSDPDYGNAQRSGKMKVLERVLSAWKKAGSRVLLFTQTRTMLDILERFMKNEGYKYQRMDGETPIGSRMNLIDTFNSDESFFVFLLTTKVGGLGVNLTGADRVVLYDPDWNPSTDIQARERAWRVGQTRPVIVYRLISSGTIEEKMYHRQIYKQFLSNKVLSDPRQKRFFKPKNMKELFTLADDAEEGTETGDIFSGTHAQERTSSLRSSANGLPSTNAGPQGLSASKPISTSWSGGTGDGIESPLHQNHDDRGNAQLLNTLFDDSRKLGLHSTINHDAILDAGSTGVDTKLLDFEAEQIANKAVEEVMRSSTRRREEGIGVPTWTGRSGVAGIGRGGSATGGKKSRAAGLLQRMRERQGLAGVASAGQPSSTNIDGSFVQGGRPVERPQSNADLVHQIINFLRQRHGVSTSASVVEHFRDRVGEESTQLAAFKAMLKRVAVLKKGSGPDGISVWELKEQHRHDL